jgi:hypothetical protein
VRSSAINRLTRGNRRALRSREQLIGIEPDPGPERLALRSRGGARADRRSAPRGLSGAPRPTMALSDVRPHRVGNRFNERRSVATSCCLNSSCPSEDQSTVVQ